MNLLLLTHRVPYPPNRGDRIRAYHLLKFLSLRHQVSLACLADEPFENSTEIELRRLTSRMEIFPQSASGRWARAALTFASGKTATSGLFASPRLKQTVRQWAKTTKFDGVIGYCSSMAPYAFVPELRGVPVYIDLVDVDSQKWMDYAQRSRGWKRQLYALEGRRLRNQECELARTASSIVLVSEAEAELFRAVCPNDRTHAILNGVELNYFQADTVSEPVRPASCVFVGALDYGANVDALEWFCDNIWSEIKRVEPAASLELVGRNPHRSVQRLATLPGVSLAANVADVRPYLRRAGVAIAPLQIARGIQNKVLEAMAMGKAVLASPGALTGLKVEAGVHVAQAETPAEWVAALIRLWESESERSVLGANAREFVAAHHSWEATLAPWESILHDNSLPANAANSAQLSAAVGKIHGMTNDRSAVDA